MKTKNFFPTFLPLLIGLTVLFVAGKPAPVFAQEVTAPLVVSFTAPVKRENGQVLPISEVGGFELRFKRVGDLLYQTRILSATSTSVTLPGLPLGDYEVKMSTFDIGGVYSESLTVATITLENNAPGAPTSLNLSSPDRRLFIPQKCLDDPNCELEANFKWPGEQ